MHTWVGRLPALPGAQSRWVVFLVLAFLGCTILLAVVNVTSVAWVRMQVALEASSGSGELLTGPEAFRNATLWYEASDPVMDALEALAGGDRRLLGGMTTGPFIPGTPDDMYTDYERAFGVRLLYAGCVVSSEDEARYRRAVDKYAERYNRSVLAATGS